jgi:hypothetical protein
MSIRVLPTKVGESVMVIVPRADLGFFKYNNRAVTVGSMSTKLRMNNHFQIHILIDTLIIFLIFKLEFWNRR